MKSDLLELFKRRGIVDGGDLEWFQVQNLVCTTVLADKLDLNRLSIGLGLEKTEYEPEQFPGLIYRNPEFECVALVFSTGKAVLTGSSDLDNIETFADHLIHKLSSFQLN
jgi:transcription initiation factor TFIID TATA-box-binding protein